jgi:hypothetical protein
VGDLRAVRLGNCDPEESSRKGKLKADVEV